MNMIKLLVTDVDGTLLDNKSELPDFNKKALLECLDRKIKVILAFSGIQIQYVKKIFS
ncbi:MAG: HAD hydrolase family protein [Actinobacteria bacterium]|nr:HAD hydrolase family protein [Actinomycetota bacterium]